ncbi:MAG TPA: type II toxin-antitoxin system YafQ family toxin [Chloroflexota bacterium]|nr:type II toxin-antitoxin system YafQ family toxin [Chloroflexota bacterium]HUM68925.1 type II toxin-antitoxin system YafQ family toxin [Chloroflexota bacterium]
MRTIRYTNQFKKDYKRAKKRRHNESPLKSVIDQLANDQPLPPQYRDHALVGNYIGTRECHIEPDWLLLYRLEGETELILVRTGSHSDLF